MVEIANISHETSSNLLYDIHHIAILVLRLIGKDHRIATQDEEASTSHGPSIKPLASSTAVRMHPIRGQRRGRGHGRLGRVGERDGRVACCSIDETFMTPEYSTPSPKTSIPHEFSTSPSHTFIPSTYSTPPLETSSPHVIPSLSPTSSALDATLPSMTSPISLPPIDETMIDFVPDLGAWPPK